MYRELPDTDWITYLKQSGNFESYDGLCDCYQCQNVRKGFYLWKIKHGTNPSVQLPVDPSLPGGG